MSTQIDTGLSEREALESEYLKTVRAEIDTFREKSLEYVAGKLTDNEFRAFRLKQGIYGQRQAGVQMVRTKVPGGLMTAAQTVQMARIADEFGGGKSHLTTRQNIQYHFVPLLRVPDLMHLLVNAGLTNREACYNTVRNVTCCPWAGLAADEVFDVRPYAQRVAFALLRKDLTQNLPRKFKICFDGCQHEDCILGPIHDVGLRALIRDGKRGFRMLVGGGLGPLPTEALLLDEFVPEEHLLHKIQAVIRVFNEYGNRKNKNTARLKFVLRGRGIEWVRESVEKQFQDILANGGFEWPNLVPEGFGGFESTPQPLGQGDLLPVLNPSAPKDPRYDAWLETNVREQRQTGYAAVTAMVDQGNLSGDQLRGIAQIASTAGDGMVRLTVNQNVVLAYIPLARLPRVYAALKEIGLGGAGANQIEDVLTCPGAYTCNLGLTKTMQLGAALQDAVRGYDDPGVKRLTIKASGCPNACGQHWISDFGFYGNARKIDGREVPYYAMLLGGGYDADGIMRFGLAIQSIPARLAPEAVRRVIDHFLANRQEGESFRNYVHRFQVATFREMTNDLAKPAELFPEIYQDWGDDHAFSLQLGRGECAA